jgi:hypothetical protein
MPRPPSPRTAKARARVGILSRHHGPDDPQTIDAKIDLEAAKLRDHIERVLAQAPPLSNEQRRRLAELLRPARRTPGKLREEAVADALKTLDTEKEIRAAFRGAPDAP